MNIFPSLLSLISLTAAHAPAAAGDASMSGSMTWASGTIASSTTTSTGFQSVQVTVAGSTSSDLATIAAVPGSTLTAGTPVAILRNGSAPFQFSTSQNSFYAGTSGAFGRMIPTNTNRQIIYDVLIPNPSTVQLVSAPFMAGIYNFKNGLTLDIAGDAPIAYGVTVTATSREITGALKFGTVPGAHTVNSQFSGIGLHVDPSQFTGTGSGQYVFFETALLTESGVTPSNNLTKAYLSTSLQF